MTAPISMCIIAREDPHIEECIKSFWQNVNEVCVIVTSDLDVQTCRTLERLKGRAAPCKLVYESFTGCNDRNDQIVDFSAARNKCISLATQPYICWVDSDDIITGSEGFAALCQTYSEMAQDIGVLFPYAYSFSQDGVCTCMHYRERLVRNNQSFSFLGAVHEVLAPTPGHNPMMFKNDHIKWKHMRQFSSKPQETGRNLRILQKYFADGGNDVRNKYYIGLEYSNVGDNVSATKYLEEYVLESKWSDEKAFALDRLCSVAISNKDYDKGLEYAFQLLKTKYNWFEAYNNICKMYYYKEQWAECVHYADIALNQPPTDTLLFVNQMERFSIHEYLNVALNHLGLYEQAISSCKEGLVGLPSSAYLSSNLLAYEKHIKGIS